MAAKPKLPARAWQRMLSGRRLDLIDPSPLDVEIEDIAHGLARVARWNGQTRGEHAFSVAQHSLLVLAIIREAEPSATPDALMMALLHDAPEYVIGDMISPFKAVIGGDYKNGCSRPSTCGLAFPRRHPQDGSRRSSVPMPSRHGSRRRGLRASQSPKPTGSFPMPTASSRTRR
jgi:HD containing hydrolase-like enzyme